VSLRATLIGQPQQLLVAGIDVAGLLHGGNANGSPWNLKAGFGRRAIGPTPCDPSLIPLPASGCVSAAPRCPLKGRGLLVSGEQAVRGQFTLQSRNPPKSDTANRQNPEGGWPEGWRCLAEEAFRRCALGELLDGEMYPYPSVQRALGMPWRPKEDGDLGY
jgi:hypothetical protein